jgi:uncharacterized protein (TIGR02266 family)
MAEKNEQAQATDQLNRARETLGEALGQIQDVSTSGLNVDQVSASLAGAVKGIFSIQSVGLNTKESLQNINHSMDQLRSTLMNLQDVQGDDPALERVTGTTARILALLYPVSKLVEQLAGDQASTPERKSSVSQLPVTDGDDRRDDLRRNLEVDIGIHSDTNFYTGFTQDISQGGLFVATYNILNIGTQLNINFSLPGGSVLSLEGTVRWVREYNDRIPDMEPGMGIMFESLNNIDTGEINKFMEEHPPIFYEYGDT